MSETYAFAFFLRLLLFQLSSFLVLLFPLHARHVSKLLQASFHLQKPQILIYCKRKSFVAEIIFSCFKKHKASFLIYYEHQWYLYCAYIFVKLNSSFLKDLRIFRKSKLYIFQNHLVWVSFPYFY